MIGYENCVDFLILFLFPRRVSITDKRHAPAQSVPIRPAQHPWDPSLLQVKILPWPGESQTHHWVSSLVSLTEIKTILIIPTISGRMCCRIPAVLWRVVEVLTRDTFSLIDLFHRCPSDFKTVGSPVTGSTTRWSKCLTIMVSDTVLKRRHKGGRHDCERTKDWRCYRGTLQRHVFDDGDPRWPRGGTDGK